MLVEEGEHIGVTTLAPVAHVCVCSAVPTDGQDESDRGDGMCDSHVCTCVRPAINASADVCTAEPRDAGNEGVAIRALISSLSKAQIRDIDVRNSSGE